MTILSISWCVTGKRFKGMADPESLDRGCDQQCPDRLDGYDPSLRKPRSESNQSRSQVEAAAVEA